MFKQITADIEPGLMKQKQEQFDAMDDQINRVFMGDIRDFYSDDCPNSSFSPDPAELTDALGDKVQVAEIISPAEESA